MRKHTYAIITGKGSVADSATTLELAGVPKSPPCFTSGNGLNQSCYQLLDSLFDTSMTFNENVRFAEITITECEHNREKRNELIKLPQR